MFKMIMFLRVPPKFNLYHQSTLCTPRETLTRTDSSLKMREPRLGPLAKGHTRGSASPCPVCWLNSHPTDRPPLDG